MYYIELTPTGVRRYLDHSPHHAEHTTFADVLAGGIDADVRSLFGPVALDELKAEVRAKLADVPSPQSSPPMKSGGVA